MPNGDSGVNETVQAKLLMDTLLDDFSNGVKLTVPLPAADPSPIRTPPLRKTITDLFHYDGTPKVAATAIHDLTTSSRTAPPTSQSFTTAPPVLWPDRNAWPELRVRAGETDGTYDIALLVGALNMEPDDQQRGYGRIQ